MGAALAFGSVVPASAAFAAPNTLNTPAVTCVDVNGGSIGPEDFDIATFQLAVGAKPTGSFNAATCQLAFNELNQEGHLNPGLTTLKIGPKVLGWLEVAPPETTTTTPTTVPATTKTCAFNVITPKETANLLGAPGKTGNALCALVLNFQRDNHEAQDGVVGSATAKQMIIESPDACAVYSSKVKDCFFGLQEKGNLGELLSIKGGKIIATMPSRFGNPNLPKGELTPEGTYPINRAIKGQRAGSLCLKIKGVILKCMRNPLYFAGKNGGIAVHGTNNPQSPLGSHGCVGVSNDNSEITYQEYEDGIKTVVILDEQRPQAA
jgi:L,D-transpeptidase catalytic domain